jgi:hypothetical protein
VDVRVADAEGNARVDHVLGGLDFIAGGQQSLLSSSPTLGRALSHSEKSSLSFGLLSVVCLSLTGDFRSDALAGALGALTSGQHQHTLPLTLLQW